MAKSSCAVRTNYFHVKDENEFRDLMSRACGDKDDIVLWEDKDADGKVVFSFGFYGEIVGIRDEETDILDENAFLGGLQECVTSDDAIIIMESHNDNLCCVGGSATVITNEGYERLDVVDLAVRSARKMLVNAKWTTKCFY